ncbi:MAG: hypothetical protein AAF335_05075 [Bacteroidota bacterium]
MLNNAFYVFKRTILFASLLTPTNLFSKNKVKQFVKQAHKEGKMIDYIENKIIEMRYYSSAMASKPDDEAYGINLTRSLKGGGSKHPKKLKEIRTDLPMTKENVRKGKVLMFTGYNEKTTINEVRVSEIIEEVGIMTPQHRKVVIKVNKKEYEEAQ